MTPRTQNRHPEAPPIPDSVAWQPIPIYNRSPQPPAPTPTPTGNKAIAAYALVLVLGTGAVGFTMYRAGVAAGESGSAAQVAQLESQASATNARIESFCQGAQQ